MGPNGVFVRLEMIHKPTEFHSSMSIGKAEVQFRNIQGGAIEPFSHAHPIEVYRMLNEPTPDVCVEFRYRGGILCP